MQTEAEDEVFMYQLFCTYKIFDSFLYWYNVLQPGKTSHKFLVKIAMCCKVTLLQSYIAEKVGY